ncbi:hypothetical protein Goklo_002755, partial [Gossypium klotzschianum]|nr:hypothetical protein [Gossypium klotzschianum]
NIPSSEVTEALAAIQAVRFAQEIGFHKVEVEGDPLVIFSKLRMQGLDRLKVSNYIWKAKHIVMGFESFKFQNIERGGNRVAHLLVKEGFILKRDVQWVDEGSTTIQEIVAIKESGLSRAT